jgi:glycosyltransferase involved in cell wall biosynthesis
MAASKAIIASQFGGMAEMIENNKSGLLVDPNDTITLEKCIQYLIDNPNKRVEYGQNAREKVLTEYSYDKILNQQVELYNQLLKKVSLND